MKDQDTLQQSKQLSINDLTAMLEATAYDLWRAALLGYSTESGKQLFDKMKTPQIGDTVMEVTSYRRITKDRMGFGTLVAKTDGDKVATEWLIRTPEGKECKWVNATFVTVPCGTFDW